MFTNIFKDKESYLSTPEEREKFNQEMLERSNLMVKIASILVAILHPLFIVLDYYTLKAAGNLNLLTQCVITRIVAVLIMFIIYYISTKPFGLKYAMELGMAEAIIASASIDVLIHYTGGYKSPYYAGHNIVFFALCVVVPIYLYKGVITALVMHGLYLLTIYLSSEITQIHIVLNNSYFMIAIAIVSLLSLYYTNRTRWKEFVLRMSLDKANKELSKLDEIKSQFFSNISHEIRTPLTSIIAPLEGYSRNVEPESGTFVGESAVLEQMTLNAKKLLKLINDLLDFTKLEAGKMQVRFSRMSLNALLEELVKSVKPLLSQKQLNFEFLIPEHDIELYMDPSKIDKIFLNLLSNAIKFTPEHGKITVEVLDNDESDSVSVIVQDTGIGIPREELPRLFERFHQVDGSSTRNFGGTGIGLNLAKEFVDLHKADINVESAVGKGTKFTIVFKKGKSHLDGANVSDELIEIDKTSLEEASERRAGDRRKEDRRYMDPKKIQLADLQADQESKQKLFDEIRKDGETAAASAEAGQADEASIHRILVVEDDAGIAALIRNSLKDRYRIKVAFDGEEGWSALQKEQFDLIVTDLMMPKLNGFELTGLAKQAERTKHIPVIILTAKGEMDFKIQGLEMGADDYLAKPFNQDELRARVKSLLSLRKLEIELAKMNIEVKDAYEKLKEAETQLIHTEKIRSLGIMLMGLAHELNNPLSFISSGSNILKKQVKKQLSGADLEDIEDTIKSIDEGVSRCFAVMQELRKFSRKEKINFEPCDIKENINSTILLVSHLLGDKIKLTAEYKSDKKVECVPGNISQVMLNILHNSIQSIPDKGEIKIRVWDDGRDYHVEFSDNGSGIGKEDLKKVFDPFFTTKDPNKGMGLGLTVCYKIISDHGGKIDIDSEKGKGTKVKITIPLEQKSRKEVCRG